MHETLSAAIILANQVQISQRFIEAVNVVDKKKKLSTHVFEFSQPIFNESPKH